LITGTYWVFDIDANQSAQLPAYVKMDPKANMNRRFWIRIFLLLVAFGASQAGAHLVRGYLGTAGRVHANLVINTVFLLTCFGCIRLFCLSLEDVGLRILRRHRAKHAGLCLAIFLTYCLYYLFVVRITGLRPYSSATVWGLLNYLVVAVAEEIYFRGLCYHLVEERTSGRAAILISGFLFGLVHFRQGLGMLPKFFTGWLWGSVRYATGMIHLLIFPVHFAYNAVWLLFKGNWDSPTTWALLLPLAELVGAVLIVICFKNAYRAFDFARRDKDGGERLIYLAQKG
jgi:membrane protease YdiL (CAAX protease family)